MPRAIESLREQAEQKFLHYGSVIGVGLTQSDETVELIFLLSRESPETRNSILRWASHNDVGVQFVVTGRIKTIDRV